MAVNGRKVYVVTAILLTAGLHGQVFAATSVLQKAIDSAPIGSTVELTAGLYDGPVSINKPLNLVGVEKGVVIRGNGKGSVLNIESSNVEIKGLEIEGSGVEHQTVDACIVVKNSNNVRVINNSMRDCLFGVNLEQSNNSFVEGNNIQSKPFDLGLRGDGIRLWYSHGNTIRKNTMRDVRDNVFWYSSNNHIEQNSGRDSRYSLHFMYANDNVVENNKFANNSVGIFLMYSQGAKVRNNVVSHSVGPFGIGIGMKDTSSTLIEGNKIMYNARGFYIDSSPYQPGTTNNFKSNEVFFNSIAFHLHGTLFGSTFELNDFKGNVDDIVNDTPESKIDLNKWISNRWDNYQGFDRDKDGYGDIPHEQWMFADRIWNYLPSAKLFFASPVLDLMNFLWRLMPFSEPELLAKDPKPRVGSL